MKPQEIDLALKFAKNPEYQKFLWKFKDQQRMNYVKRLSDKAMKEQLRMIFII